MLTRLTHAAIAFAVTAALYQAYVLAVVPFVEPGWAPDYAASQATDDLFEEGRVAPDKYRDLLAAYFPADHWCFKSPPKTFENGQAMVVLDQYQQSQNGELRVPHCAIVFFPRPRVRGAAPPSDAIILEPAGGAVLQMDQTVGSKSGGFGRMQFGQLLGDVSVRSDMRDPGPQDDLAIATRDLYLNEDGIRTTRTDEAVTMQLGQHFGRGRGLEIRFLQAESSRSNAPGALYGNLDSLKILQEVSAEIAPAALGVFNSLGEEQTSGSGVRGSQPADSAPIRIQSDGPFRIEFAHYVATFSTKVRLRQIHADGKLDQLLAEELHLYFTKATRWGEDSDDGLVTPTPESAGSPSFALEPASIIAKGDEANPVLLKAPSQDASATGQRLWIELAKRKITLDGGDEVMLSYRGAEIRAPMVEYQLPPKGSTARVGSIWARGAGRLQAAVDPQRPQEILEVRWTDSMRLVRRQDASGYDQPVLVLDGRPRISHSAMGTLWADRLEVFLREQSGDAIPAPAKNGASAIPSSIAAERITASGRVAIKSAQLTADVNQLDIQIDNAAGPSSAATLASDSGSPMSLLPQAGAAQSGYEIKGVVLRVKAAMRNRSPQVTAVTVDGRVDFKETPLAGIAEPGLQILAERLTVTGADTPNAEIEILGGGGQNGVAKQMAKINARGAKILAPSLIAHRGTGQALINSAGTVELLVERDLSGKLLPQPERIEVTWHKSMQLDRDRLTFDGGVRVQQSGGGWLETDRLVVQMTKPVDFNGANSQEKPEVAQLECWGGAVAEFDQRDATGVTSRQHIEVKSLMANRVTGLISGDGPGYIDSVHFSREAALLAAPNPAVALPVAPLAPAGLGNRSLRHLHIDFVRGVGGNLLTSTINVQGDVRAVYGPVANWDQRLAMSPGGRPGAETVWITCDELAVTESPAARLQNPPARLVELEARRRVEIEGQDAKGGIFSAQGHIAKYDQSKAMFILEGDGSTPATIAHQQFAGAPSSPQSAQKLTYWQNTGRVQIHGLQKGQLNQIDVGGQPGPPLR